MGLTRPRAHQLQETSFKFACRAISTSNVTLSGGAPATVDGVSVTQGDRVLVIGQTNKAQNGIYNIATVGTGSNGTWNRTKDADDANDITAGTQVSVTEGTTYGDTVWKLTTDGDITIGTTDQDWEQASAYGFGTVTVDGTSLVADTVGDTLTVSEGTNISLSSDAGTDTFTIATVDAPTFSGNLTAGNLTTAGQMQADLVRNREQRYTTSNMMKFNQLYTGGANGTYFTQNEYQKIVTITPDADSQNYQVSGRILAQSAGSIQIINFTAALRSETLPNLDWSITYDEQNNGIEFFKPQLWTKETSTAGFIFAIQYLHNSNLYGTVTVDLDVIPRSSDQLDNVTINTTQDSEQTSIDAGYTANDMTLVRSIENTAVTFSGNITGGNLITGGLASVTGNITGGNLVTANDVTTATVTATGNVSGNNIVSTNDVTTATVTASGNIETTGGFFLGDGSQLTNLPDAGNAFTTIAISGQSDIVADSSSDTLTFTAGTGITLTTDAGTDTLTITAETAAFPFAQDSDFESVTDDPASTTEDLGDLASTNEVTYDLGTIISAEGLIYPGQLVLPQYATASLPDATVEGQLAYDTDTNSIKFTDGSSWNSYLSSSGNITQTSTDLVNSQSEGNYATKRYVLHGTTTDATETEIFVGGTANSRISISSNTTVTADAVFTARRTDATGHSAGFHIYAVADNFSGTTADVGNVYEVTIADDTGNLAVDLQADDTTDSLKVLVQGEASKTISWMCVVNTVEVSQ